jgi:hypothetical protein
MYGEALLEEAGDGVAVGDVVSLLKAMVKEFRRCRVQVVIKYPETVIRFVGKSAQDPDLETEVQTG